MSEDEEIFSLGKRWILISVIYGVSLTTSIIYLCCRVDRKQTSYIIFVLCIIYTSLFVFLNIIAVLDLFFNSKKGFGTLIEIISKFYTIFDYVDKILGFVIFTWLIFYLESGHYSKIKRLLDYPIRIYQNIKKLSKCEIIVILSISIPLITLILTFLIIYRNKFGLKYNPLDYINVLLNCYAAFEIYTCVGFFIIQVIIDYRRHKNDKLIKRYYRYSTKKIIEKTEQYFGKLKKII